MYTRNSDIVFGDIVNLTPHVVTLIRENGDVVDYHPSGIVARVQTNYVQRMELDGFPLSEIQYGEIELSNETDWVDLIGNHCDNLYIVSAIVANAARNTNHPLKNYCISPDTGNGAVRVDGKIVGVRGWTVY